MSLFDIFYIKIDDPGQGGRDWKREGRFCSEFIYLRYPFQHNSGYLWDYESINYYNY